MSRRDALHAGLAGGFGIWLGRPGPSKATIGGLGSDELDALLQELVSEHQMPGAIVGVYRDGQITAAAAGSAISSMTPDTAFLIGSITKVWTASLLMTFVDEGASISTSR